MTRMFTYDGKSMTTWNVFTGCRFDCTYCNAKKTALTRLKHFPTYGNGFEPQVVEKLMGRRFRAGSFVFVAYMGDIAFAPKKDVERVLDNIREQPEVRFLFCTKNPFIYLYWRLDYPDNLSLAATIETNFDYKLSKAPAPEERYKVMKYLDHPHKLISIEPLMNFRLATMIKWMKEIGPEIIEVGPDNYNNHLVEPYTVRPSRKAPWKVQWLLEELKKFCPNVVEKEGLGRLLEGAY